MDVGIEFSRTTISYCVLYLLAIIFKYFQRKFKATLNTLFNLTSSVVINSTGIYRVKEKRKTNKKRDMTVGTASSNGQIDF